MSAVFVVDCSVAMAWFFKDEGTPETLALLQRLDVEAGVVPSWWYLEVANVVAMAERKGRVTREETAQFLRDMNLLNLELDEEGPARAFDPILELCRKYSLTSYDALYLDLAMRRRLPLATLDRQLRAAAELAGVKVLPTSLS